MGGGWNGGGDEEVVGVWDWGGDAVLCPPPPHPICSHCDTPRRKVAGGALQRCRLSRASSGSSQDSISSEGSDAGGCPPHAPPTPPHPSLHPAEPRGIAGGAPSVTPPPSMLLSP